MIKLEIRACAITSDEILTPKNRQNIFNDIKKMFYKLVYISPEMLVDSPGLNQTLGFLYSRKKIDRFVIDEMHCISSWGKSFRKSYL